MAPGSVYSTEVGSAEVVAEQYHLAIIESGATVEKAAAQAAYFGKRVIAFEKERAPGGAAVQTGTLPSKTLRESSVFLSGHRSRQL